VSSEQFGAGGGYTDGHGLLLIEEFDAGAMLLKLIACNVFMREACYCIARSPHVIDVEFIELGEHIHPETLRVTLQTKIDAASQNVKQYEAILLLFGICGNAGVELQARGVPLVMPRAHDCCTILLGSRAAFKEHFGANPSMPFSSSGYLERGDYYLREGEDGEMTMHFGDQFAALVEQYGEEDAHYIWETMHPEQPNDQVVFIELPETAPLGYAEQFRAKAEADGKTCLHFPGSIRLIKHLLNGEWDAEEFLIIPPGHKSSGVYDFEEVLRAVLVGNEQHHTG